MTIVVAQPLDRIIIIVFVRWNMPVDQILRNPIRAQQFCEEVRREDKELNNLDDETILSRVLNLRKIGEDKGGLPRLRRNKPKPR